MNGASDRVTGLRRGIFFCPG